MSRKTNSLTVLTYHRITDIPDFQDPLKLSISNFEKQMSYLNKYYKIISAKQLTDIIRKQGIFPENSCLITFDDGWLDNYTNAYPILKKYGIPAVIFVSTDYIGTYRMFWHERLCNILMRILPNNFQFNGGGCALPVEVEKRVGQIVKMSFGKRRPLINNLIEYLKSYSPTDIDSFTNIITKVFGVEEGEKQPSILTWEQIREMCHHNICFASHTKSHALLTQVADAEIVSELNESKALIEEKLGKPVFLVSYPNGFYNDQTIKIAREAGYLAGFTCLMGTNDMHVNPFELQRIHIRENRTTGLRGQFSELFFKVELSGLRSKLQPWRKKKHF